MLATIDYHRWITTNDALREALGSLSNYLWSTLPTLWFPAVLATLGLALARRGRRRLFAGPAVAVYVVPIVIALLRGTPEFAYPGLPLGHWASADYGIWVPWTASTVRLVLVVLPGGVVAARTEGESNAFRAPAMLLLAVPAALVAYLGILFFSYDGRLDGSQAATFAAAFLFGAGMGFDRPWWPWVLVVAPGLREGILSVVYVGQGGEVLVVLLITLLGALSVPLSRVLLRGWQENLAPGTQPGLGPSAPDAGPISVE